MTWPGLVPKPYSIEPGYFIMLYMRVCATTPRVSHFSALIVLAIILRYSVGNGGAVVQCRVTYRLGGRLKSIVPEGMCAASCSYWSFLMISAGRKR